LLIVIENWEVEVEGFGDLASVKAILWDQQPQSLVGKRECSNGLRGIYANQYASINMTTLTHLGVNQEKALTVAYQKIGSH
jgi:hypothetical protein